MPFQHIRSVVNFIQDKCELCYSVTTLLTLMWTARGDLFGFLVRYPEDIQEKLLVFQVAS